MCTLSVKEIATIRGVSERTFYSDLKDLKKQKKFKRKSKRKFFDEHDARKLARLMGFETSLERYLNK